MEWNNEIVVMNITPPYNFNSSIEILANFQIKFPRYDEGGGIETMKPQQETLVSYF